MGVVFGAASPTGPKFILLGPGRRAGDSNGSSTTNGLLGLGFEFHFKLAEWLSLRFAGAGSVCTGSDCKLAARRGRLRIGGRPGWPPMPRCDRRPDVLALRSMSSTRRRSTSRWRPASSWGAGNQRRQQLGLLERPEHPHARSLGLRCLAAPVAPLGLTANFAFVRPQTERDSVTTSRNGVRLGLLADFDRGRHSSRHGTRRRLQAATCPCRVMLCRAFIGSRTEASPTAAGRTCTGGSEVGYRK